MLPTLKAIGERTRVIAEALCARLCACKSVCAKVTLIKVVEIKTLKLTLKVNKCPPL